MRKQMALFAALALSVIQLLSACEGNPLPSGMDESTLLEAGKDVMLLMVGGDYDAVYGMLRDDVAASTTPEAIGELVLRQTENAGTYKQIDSSMATGQSSNGEEFGVAVLYCDFSKKGVLFRLAFDTNMDLIGMDIKQQ